MNDSTTITECAKARLGRPPQMPPPAREAAILRATTELLQEIPFDDVTMTAIAARAGMSKRTVYEHFTCREDLLVRAVSDLLQTIFVPLSAKDAARPLPERLSLLLQLNGPPECDAHNLECLRSIVAKAQTFPLLAAKLHANGHGALAGFLAAELARATELSLDPKDIPLAAEMLLDMAFENTLTQLLHPGAPLLPQAQIDRRREFAIALFLRGFSAKP